MSVQAPASAVMILALSARALAVQNTEQVTRLEKSVRLVPLELPTTESAGGSARRMIAGLHLARCPHSRSN